MATITLLALVLFEALREAIANNFAPNRVVRSGEEFGRDLAATGANYFTAAIQVVTVGRSLASVAVGWSRFVASAVGWSRLVTGAVRWSLVMTAAVGRSRMSAVGRSRLVAGAVRWSRFVAGAV